MPVAQRGFRNTAELHSEKPPFNKILIANRGEIACRVMKTAKRMGIKTVAVYSDADAQALHVSMADEAINIGPAAAAESYLVADKILEAIRTSGAEAVHPGYGFLSENAEFSDAVNEMGVQFIGPPADAIIDMGCKIKSMRIAQAANVNCAPRHDGEVDTPERALEIADGLGYPIIMKAAAGGGGKGMRIAWKRDELVEGFNLARQEAKASFNDDRMMIQHYVAPDDARHIEIQIMGDKHGNYLHFPERECSIQRRHQKVVEEAPSTVLTPEQRKVMGEQAVSLARAVGYHSAGTVEFLVDSKGKHYFLEMNTRLQVEHPITECITGVDLVEQMIRVAAGEKLDMTQDDVKINGWAIESRVYAEDSVNYLPSIGRLSKYEEPTASNPDAEWPDVRCDTGVVEGSEISVYYDPMICKLVTYGKDRTEALSLMANALDNYVIKGVDHNIPLLRDIIEQDRFVTGALTTEFLPEVYPDKFPGYALNSTQKTQLAVSALSIHLQQEVDRASFGHSAKADLNAIYGEFVVLIDGEEHAISSEVNADGGLKVSIDGNEIPVSSDWTPGSSVLRGSIGGENVVIQTIEVAGYHKTLRFFGSVFNVTVLSKREHELWQYMPEKVDEVDLNAIVTPMPGVCVSVSVQPGDEVSAGQVVAVLEAMKMQNNMTSPRAGIVKAVHVTVGESLDDGTVIVELEDVVEEEAVAE